MLSAVLGVSYLMKVCSCGEKETPEKPFYDKSSVCRGCYNTKRAPKQKEYRSKPEVKKLMPFVKPVSLGFLGLGPARYINVNWRVKQDRFCSRLESEEVRKD